MSFPDAQVMQISMPNAIKAMEIMLVMAGLSLSTAHAAVESLESAFSNAFSRFPLQPCYMFESCRAS